MQLSKNIEDNFQAHCAAKLKSQILPSNIHGSYWNVSISGLCFPGVKDIKKKGKMFLVGFRENKGSDHVVDKYISVHDAPVLAKPVVRDLHFGPHKIKGACYRKNGKNLEFAQKRRIYPSKLKWLRKRRPVGSIELCA